jgi:hypothetical protein
MANENGTRFGKRDAENGNSIEIDKDQDDKRKRRALRKPSCLVWSFAYRGSLGHLHPSLEALTDPFDATDVAPAPATLKTSGAEASRP